MILGAQQMKSVVRYAGVFFVGNETVHVLVHLSTAK